MRRIFAMICLAMIVVWVSPSEQVKAANFKDVLRNHTLKTEIDYLIDRDIIKGYPDGTFKPNDSVTRAQAAVLLTRALGLNTSNVKNPNYQDVPVTHTYYREIAAAHNAGIFQTAQKFTPSGTIPRGTMAIILQRAFQLEDSDTNYFADVTERTDGYQAILAMANNSITRGYQDGTFKPNVVLTRAHFSAFMARALTISKHKLIKDRKYMYTYAFTSTEDNHTYTLNYKYSHNDGKNDVWTITNTTNSKLFNDELLYYEDFVYGQAIAQEFSSHYDLFIELPLRIGIVRHEDDDGVIGGIRITVKDTKATLQANGVTYNNVAILEETNVFNTDVNLYYFADNIGLVKQMKNGKVIYELLKQTAY
ncbi:S-layer homology domain-containing protein [Lysinibacillus sp. NPDC097287]|uniref:S-layer homology domain-containing protein n=1 Tax=Lysinibacillus sp. NPDC097287 TaxID=3364144 RepID=UPI0038033377